MSGSIQNPPTASMLISAGQAGVVPVSFGSYPPEGSRCVSAQYSWLTQAGYNEDLSRLVALGVETTIQSVFVDNSTNAQAVSLLVSGSDQLAICPANSQGIFPLFFTGAAALQITVPATGAGVTRCYFLNVPAGACVWGAQSPGFDPAGGLYVDTESLVPTYSAATLPVTAAAAPTDIFTIYGSATKTVRVHEISLQGLATANSMIDAFVIKRSTADAGGTSAPATAVPHDSANAAATATVLSYTVNPASLGTSAGIVEGSLMGFSPNSNTANPVFTWGPGAAGDQAIVLRGVAQGLALNLNGVGAAGLAFVAKVKWTES